MNSLYDPLKTIVERVVGKPEITQRSPTLSIGDKSPLHSSSDQFQTLQM
jgi:hypothetical protein